MKKRCSNFAPNEVQILLENLQKYKHNINSKRTDRITIENRSKIWSKIAREINHKCGTDRNGENVRIKYKNMKKIAKLNLSRGPNASFLTPVDNVILSICEDEEILGVESLWNDDTCEMKDEPATNESEVPSDEFSEKENDGTEEAIDWSQYTQNMLNTPSHTVFAPKRSITTNECADFTVAKLRKIEAEICFIESQTQESELRKQKLKLEMEFMKEKHKIEMEILMKQT